jgi:polyhydroxyalkanoate synthesis regulator phasin|tara:strand:+ start:456 stop:830 length:375 start_codon:yes stop_codon:yes gene_type:complete
METLKTLTYAGLGLAMQTNEKIKAEFNELVEVGKKSDLEGKNIVGDFFKTVESTKDTIENKIEKNKTIVFDNLPFLRELEVKMNEKSEEVKSTFKDSINKAKDSFYSRNESESANEETTVVEEK